MLGSPIHDNDFQRGPKKSNIKINNKYCLKLYIIKYISWKYQYTAVNPNWPYQQDSYTQPRNPFAAPVELPTREAITTT